MYNQGRNLVDRDDKFTLLLVLYIKARFVAPVQRWLIPSSKLLPKFLFFQADLGLTKN